jgi:phosphonate transport system substrate-binding protein
MSRRSFCIQSCLFIAGLLGACAGANSSKTFGELSLGTIAYADQDRSLEKYQRFIAYLESQTKQLVRLEPAFNEVMAREQIQQQAWSIVFAPAGLAAIAIAQSQYLPLFPLQGVINLTSVLVVPEDSPIQTVQEVSDRVVGLGQPGSATGYYVPLYELYGTAPSEIRLAPTPKLLLDGLIRGEIEVGAVSQTELEQYRAQFPNQRLRVFHASRRVPPGAVLISPQVDRNQQELIQQVMQQALPEIAQEAGFIPNAPPPDYRMLIEFIRKVEPIESRIHEKPARLYQ